MFSEWSAAMISPVEDFAGAPLLRTEFALDDGHGAVMSAELAVSSLPGRQRRWRTTFTTGRLSMPGRPTTRGCTLEQHRPAGAASKR